MLDTEIKSNLAASPRSQIGSGCECRVFKLADHESIVCKQFWSACEAELAYKRQIYAYDNGLAPRALFYDGGFIYYSEEVISLGWCDFNYNQICDIEKHTTKKFEALYGADVTDMHIENIGATSDGLVLLDYGSNSFARFGTEIKTHY